MKIFHTSDLHLGMKFMNYPEVQEELRDARYTALETMVRRANEEKCEIFVMAGDLFDRVTVSIKEIKRAAELLNKLTGPVAMVLPGNHDFISSGVDDLWKSFEDIVGNKVLILKEPKIYGPDIHHLDVNIYSAPCNSKHAKENRIGWIKDIEKDRTVTFHIGIAHGSLEGFSPDMKGEYFPMTERELLGCKLDMWLLGHTHLHYPPSPEAGKNIFYAGTPEPDGFDCRHEGTAFIIEIDNARKISCRRISTGTYRFLDKEHTMSMGELDRLASAYAPLDLTKTLLRMTLSGRLSAGELASLSTLRSDLNKRAMFFKWNQNDVREEITPEKIDHDYTEGSFPHRLLSRLAEQDDLEGLQVAYELMGGTGK